MTLTLQEAKAKGRIWAERYAPQPQRTFVPLPDKKSPSDEQKQRDYLARRKARAERLRIRNASYFEALVAELSKTEWRRSKDIAAKLKLPIQVFKHVVGDAEKEGIVKRHKSREMVWLTDPECTLPPPEVWHNAGKERVRKPEVKRQRLDVGEAQDAWRAPR